MTSSHKWPPIQNTKIFPVKALQLIGTSSKRPPPVSDRDHFLRLPVNNCPLFFTSCKRPLERFSDLYVCCVHYATKNIRRTLVTTWNYTWRNLEVACNKFIVFLKIGVSGLLLRRGPPVVRFLSATTSRKQPLSLCILGDRLWEVQLYFPSGGCFYIDNDFVDSRCLTFREKDILQKHFLDWLIIASQRTQAVNNYYYSAFLRIFMRQRHKTQG